MTAQLVQTHPNVEGGWHLTTRFMNYLSIGALLLAGTNRRIV